MPALNGSEGSFGITTDVAGNFVAVRSSMSGVPFMLPVTRAYGGSLAQFPIIVPPTFAGSSLTTSTSPSSAVSYELCVGRNSYFLPLCTLNFAAGATTGTFGPPNAELLLPSTSWWPGTAGAILIVPGDNLLMQYDGNDSTFSNVALMLAAFGL
jgi:hypothetical protein